MDTYHTARRDDRGQALVHGAEEIFRRHGCEADIECTQEHHVEYVMVDLSLTCHIDDTDALIADLNAALASESVPTRDGGCLRIDVSERSSPRLAVRP